MPVLLRLQPEYHPFQTLQPRFLPYIPLYSALLLRNPDVINGIKTGDYPQVGEKRKALSKNGKFGLPARLLHLKN